ncbi:MAG: hybrid sensor histidine kinase/response regulator, partial [Methyloligellaceae bacterium]
DIVTLLAFIGGLSAATAMVIVATVALPIMVCNDLVIPLILYRKTPGGADRKDMGTLLLNIRRSAIFAILVLGYAVYRLIGDSYALASIGLLSFAAIAQFAPALFGGLFWRRATARGAIAGIVTGFAVWAYTLLLPSLAGAGLVSQEFLHQGPYGIGMLQPQMLFNLKFDPLTHGVIWSIFLNIAAYTAFSLMRPPKPIERLQANAFIENEFPRPHTPAFRLSRTSVTVDALKKTAARYLGQERTERSFIEYAASRGIVLFPHSEADVHLLRYTEHLLASAIGAASSRLVLSLLLRRKNVAPKAALKLLDDASEALQYNRDLLQSALDQVRQGISVYDDNFQLICWNHQFRNLLGLPPELGRVGVPLDEIIRFVAANNATKSEGSIEHVVSDRIEKYAVTNETFQERLDDGDKVIEIRTDSMPQGGIVTTYTDITGQVAAAEALARANETLERRVRERTAELMNVNAELGLAKSKADEANLDKTRFLAAASHDILQPLNAARLFVSSLTERHLAKEDGRLVGNVDASLEAVEDILNALLDISRLDTGAMKPEFSVFPIKEMLDQLKLEFEPLAKDKGLDLRVIDSCQCVRSDRRLLRRVLQNLVSNAIKYTEEGRVLLGCRLRGADIVVQVGYTGPGIPKRQQPRIFKEFQRYMAGSQTPHGVGLGLSIVERIGRVLEQPITLEPKVGKGSVFSISLPIAKPAFAAPSPRQARPRVGEISGQTVLCIDNEPAVLDGMSTLISGWKCRVLRAISIAEAAEKISRETEAPDIIIADYHLDDGTGLDAIRNFRHAIGYDVPAVVVTADRSPEVQDQVRNEGLTLLRKPLKPAQLRAFLAQSLVRRTAAE